jgi:hypothetical protein
MIKSYKRILLLCIIAMLFACICGGCAAKSGGSVSLAFPGEASGVDISPFTVTLTLPSGWSLADMDEDAFPIFPMLSKRGLSNAEGEMVGAIGFCPYDPIEGMEDDPRAIYSQIALGNDYKFNVRDTYTVIQENDDGETAITTVDYAASINGGAEKTNRGIVAYNRDKLVYVAIELDSDALSDEQAEAIAQSLLFT